VICVALSVAALVFLGAALRCGSWRAALAWLSGAGIHVEAATSSPVRVSAGRAALLSYDVTNLGFEPLAILGVETGCSCAVVEDLPVTLGTMESKRITVRMRTSAWAAGQMVTPELRLLTNPIHTDTILRGVVIIEGDVAEAHRSG
jgi:hypothetical protein